MRSSKKCKWCRLFLPPKKKKKNKNTFPTVQIMGKLFFDGFILNGIASLNYKCLFGAEKTWSVDVSGFKQKFSDEFNCCDAKN